MGKDKPQTRDSEYDKINQLYDECLIYLETLNEKHCDENSKLLSNGKETKDTYEEYPEEPGYETIKVKDEIKIEPQPQPKKVPIKLVVPEEPVLVEARNECISPQLMTAVEDELSKIKNVPVQIVIPEELMDAKNENISPAIAFAVENELKSNENLSALPIKRKMSRLRRLSEQIPKIIITRSPGIDIPKQENHLKLDAQYRIIKDTKKKTAHVYNIARNPPPLRTKTGYGDFPKRVVTKSGIENVALISNVPYEKIRLLNDTFHTLINLRWRWIVSGTIVVHFAMWLVFAVFWYITALAHYDFDPDPPKKSCITGGTDFVTIFLASVEAQTTIGFGDRAIDEECPESIFLFIMQLILGTGLSGVLTCVVYAKLTRPEKLSRDGVGFSKKAVISMRDGRLCLMLRAWDLNFDHIISSEFTAHFINTHKTTEGELLRYYARTLSLQQRQFLLWPVTLVHTIDATSPLFQYTPELLANNNYEITVSLKGASASLGTFTQSQTSYMPKEIVWGHRFPSVVQFDSRKQKYVIDHKKLDVIEPVDTPMCSAMELYNSAKESEEPPPSPCPTTPSSFNERISSFVLQRSSSFRNKEVKS